MKIKMLNVVSPRKKILVVTCILISFGSFAILNFLASRFHPKYHHKVIRHLKPLMDKVNLNAQEFMKPNNFNIERFIFQADKEPIEIDPAYEKYISELGLTNPGEFGAAVMLPPNISEEIKNKIDEGYKRHGFNAFVSNLVSLNRKLNDTRPDQCKNKTYIDLPKCSIIIPFHNEEWSLLLRTIHAIVNRSPDELIEEILLVDDASDRDEMHEALEKYMKRFPKVKILRSYLRHGLIETRMLGTANAKGPIIVFLDSHVEVSYGWLEPVLDRFKYRRELLVTMWHLGLEKDTLKYNNYEEKNPRWVGGFRWSLDFMCISIQKYEGDNPTPLYEPKQSPTVWGSMHAIRKDYFVEIGMYDPGFDIWGGEDVELAFRVWCCGGYVEVVPCSQAAHMSKDHKYTWPKSDKGGYRWNTDRIAELWLDEYKKYYYEAVGDTKNRNYGDISERVALKEKLNCKNFRWFYETVYKNWPIDDH